VTITASTDGVNGTAAVDVDIVFAVNSADDIDDAMCDVTHCSFREALNAANANPGIDMIGFSIPGAGPHTIRPASALPTITDPVVIDGTTEPDFAGTPIVELDGSSAGSVQGLDITAANSTIRGLVINRFERNGVQITGAGATGNVVEGNFIGTNVAGTAALGNGVHGVSIVGAPGNIVGGTTSAARNIISANAIHGVGMIDASATGNVVQGNYIGTDVTGTSDLGNGGNGVNLDKAPANTVGGTTPEAHNVISGNDVHGVGIFLPGASGNVVQGNFIGTDANGTADLGNTQNGVNISGAPDNAVGGTTPEARNVISGNDVHGVGISLPDASGNVVQGNFIGTDANGTADLGNTQNGVNISGAPDNSVGGTTTGARNVISGNDVHGVGIFLPGASGNVVQGNFIGTDITGSVDVGNAGSGVTLSDATTNTVGGDTTTARNVISGNWDGVVIMGVAATGNRVVGNYIGTDLTGSVVLPNTGVAGVHIDGAPDNEIGGTLVEERNIISGNGDGIFVSGGNATGNLIRGNYIGTDAAGTVALGNDGQGVFISAPGNTIGGTTSGAGNVISGNAEAGIRISDVGATGNVVEGNYIGTDAGGSVKLGNGFGMSLSQALNTVGGTIAEARNVISGNGIGIVIEGSDAANNVIQGNYIGTDAAGSADLGNDQHGINIHTNASNNTIGGTDIGAGNTVAFNGGDGVSVATGTGNQVLSNMIFSNTGLGIDLGGDGITDNDAGDGDTGANNLQNFPVLASGISGGGSITILGDLNSAANTDFSLEFFANSACDPSGNGQGETFLGSTVETTDGSGNASFTATFTATVAVGQFITVTATDPNNNTSEFSQCMTVTG
jgi:titin